MLHFFSIVLNNYYFITHFYVNHMYIIYVIKSSWAWLHFLKGCWNIYFNDTRKNLNLNVKDTPWIVLSLSSLIECEWCSQFHIQTIALNVLYKFSNARKFQRGKILTSMENVSRVTYAHSFWTHETQKRRRDRFSFSSFFCAMHKI